MTQGFMIGSECADWWQKQLDNYHKELEEYVQKNPGNFGVIVATAKATVADLVVGSYFIDLPRLGEGFAQGGAKGVVQDLLRIMNFIPEAKVIPTPKGAVGKLVQYVKNLKIWRKVEGGLCAPIAIAQALQRTGQKLGVGLAEIAGALNTPLIRIFKDGVESWRSIGPALRRLGVDFAEIPAVASGRFGEVAQIAESAAGPVMVRIYGIQRVGDRLVPGGHAILVGRTRQGVQIIDRYGFFRSLEELSKHYNMAGVWKIDTAAPMYVFKNCVIDGTLKELINHSSVLALLVRTSIGVFDFNRAKVTADFVKKDFERFVAERRGAGKPPAIEAEPMVVTGGKSVLVTRGDPDSGTLSGIAMAEYRDWQFWPLIWDLNRQKIGPNPNRLKPGVKLLVLPLRTYSAQEQADARRRAPSWRNYPA